MVGILLMRREGFGHNSQLAVARLGRDPASRFFLVKKHRSGFQIPLIPNAK